MDFVCSTFLLVFIVAATVCLPALATVKSNSDSKINRRAVVQRHNIVINASGQDKISFCDVMAVGNGAFALNIDITGTQTFNDSYTGGRCGFDLNTMVREVCCA